MFVTTLAAYDQNKMQGSTPSYVSFILFSILHIVRLQHKNRFVYTTPLISNKATIMGVWLSLLSIIAHQFDT